MPDEIIAQPNPLLLSSGVEGLLEIGGSVTIEGEPEGMYPSHYTVNPPSGLIFSPDNEARIYRPSTSAAWSDAVKSPPIPRQQPFQIMGWWEGLQPTPRDQWLGVIDNFGRWSILEPFRFPPEPQARFFVWENGVRLEPFQVGAGGDGYAVQSNGTTITMLRWASGTWRFVRSFPIPSNVTSYRMAYAIAYNGVWRLALTRIDTKVIPLTTSNVVINQSNEPPLIIRTASTNHFGVLAENVGTFQLHPTYEPDNLTIPVEVQVEPLYIRPKTSGCGGIAIQGEIYEFESNGGSGGIFEASGGTILSNLRWQAPDVEGIVTFTYTIGNVSATCELEVVKRLRVIGVDEDNFYPDIAQGDRVEFESTCPGARFRSITHPFIVNPRGVLFAPTDAKNASFGEKIVTIQVTGCGQIYEFFIRVQPLFPTPKFCGATPLKWLEREPDFLPNTLTMTGGTSQVKNRNKEGIRIWEIEYDLMAQKELSFCTCNDTDTHSETCETNLSTASRLDAFYQQVKYTHYFTVIDYHTGIRYKYVRLTRYEKNHNLFKTEQARRLTMRWEGDLDFGTPSSECLPEDCPPCPPTVVQLNWDVIQW